MARPELPIDPEQVKKLASFGLTTKQIANFLKCSVDTLDRRFAEQIALGRLNAANRLLAAQWRSAIDRGNVSMQQWLGANVLGQASKVEQTTEITGKDGGALKAEINFDYDQYAKLFADVAGVAPEDDSGQPLDTPSTD